MRAAASTVAALLIGTALTAPASADGFPGGAALSDAQLDTLRGGFIGDDGMKITLGIERLVHVNGELVSSTMLRVPDLSALRARGFELQGPAMSLVQNGPGNAIDPGVLQTLGPGMLTLVQNSLNGQVIRGTTRIDLTISGSSTLRISETLSGLRLQLHSAR
jgi:hypothetical protein